MQARHLMIVCGVPGAGKSTFSRHVAETWGALSFASETFAAMLGPTARAPSGDLSQDAIAHAYSAMEAAVSNSFKTNSLILAVGSFRAESHRLRFRRMADCAGAKVITLRIICSVEVAARRVRERIAKGEHGPTERAIRSIDAELSQAKDIDFAINNEGSLACFHRRIASFMTTLSS